MSKGFKNIQVCRCCGSDRLSSLVHLGETPIADRLLQSDQLAEQTPMVPLELLLCESCSLVQIRQTVDPEVLFCSDYPYFSTVSPRLCQHFADSALNLIERLELDDRALVVEAASNDGYMLRHFAEHEIPVLGIDPAERQVQLARERGVQTLCDFFTSSLAQRLVGEGLQADLFLANNVLAHVADLNGFVQGIAHVLKPTGLAVIEVPYVVDMLDYCAFDTIYHQHLCYFSVCALQRLFKQAGLYLNDVERVPVHGGSLRLFVSRESSTTKQLEELATMERERGLVNFEAYKGFLEQIARVRRELPAMLRELKTQGLRVAGYGAAAKASTLLSVCGIDASLLEYVVDMSSKKHGLWFDGLRLPIYPVERIQENKPDVLLLLAWNFAGEIMQQQKGFIEAGGQFLLPLPIPKLLGADSVVPQSV